MSILDNQELSKLLQLPDAVVPLAYLCVGYPEEFPEKPLLQTVGWRPRLPLGDLVYSEAWGTPCEAPLQRLLEQPREDRD